MNGSPRYHPERDADVCFLLEGTYPYVRGGVSSWIKQLIEGMPEVRFSIVYLGALASDQTEPAYELPENLVHLEIHALLEDVKEDAAPLRPWNNKRRVRDRFSRNAALHASLSATGRTVDDKVADEFTELLCGQCPMTHKDLLESPAAWDLIQKHYRTAPPDQDFNHYFWTVRGMHSPLFVLARIARSAPSACIYHAVSTGYAGFLGAMLQSRTGKPYLLTEHGIYTKERELDLAQVDWIPPDSAPFDVGMQHGMGHLRKLWIHFFHSLGRIAYSKADRIYTLYSGNRDRQINDGAPPARLEIIPNGVNVRRFVGARRDNDAPVPPVLALIGRVVPIKDIKTFVRAMRIVKSRVPDVEGWLIGPEDEDPGYTRECRLLVESMGLSDTVKFLGFQKPEEIFPQVGLTVLTSVSEGQPLVMLEGFAAGIPALSTDVGSCSELIFGNTAEDRALGIAGAIVPIADPSRFADAAIRLLIDRELWGQARDAAIARVETYYDDQTMLQRYSDVYEEFLMHSDIERQAS